MLRLLMSGFAAASSSRVAARADRAGPVLLAGLVAVLAVLTGIWSG